MNKIKRIENTMRIINKRLKLYKTLIEHNDDIENEGNRFNKRNSITCSNKNCIMCNPNKYRKTYLRKKRRIENNKIELEE
jgi:hypothetical protein